jgi:hypothetical protein
MVAAITQHPFTWGNMMGSEIYKLAERMEKTTRRELQKFKS